MRTPVGVLTVLIAGAICLQPALFGQNKTPSKEEVAKLIEQLGDDDADVRKEAAGKLVEMGEPALPALRLASQKATDADVRLRAAVAAAAIRKKLYGEIHVFEGHKGWACRVVVLPGGKQAISLGDFLRVWDLETGKEVRHFAPDGYLWGLSISGDGKLVLSSRSDNSVRLYEVETGKEVQKLVGHTGQVWVACLSANGKTAVTGGLDRTLRLWDVETGKELASGSGHTGAITAVVWSKDGKRLATSSFDKTLRVWDAATGKELKRIVASTQGCDGVAITPDGKRLVSTGWGSDFAVRLWQIDTGKELVRYDGHTGSALWVAVTPDGKKAISCDTAGTVRLWPLPKE